MVATSAALIAAEETVPDSREHMIKMERMVVLAKYMDEVQDHASFSRRVRWFRIDKQRPNTSLQRLETMVEQGTFRTVWSAVLMPLLLMDGGHSLPNMPAPGGLGVW